MLAHKSGPGGLNVFTRLVHLSDMMAVLFPFEVKYYEDANIPVRYVGHPLASRAKANVSPQALRDELNISADKKIIGLLPR